MSNTIQHKRSETPGAVPTAAQLALGELAINVADGKLFAKKLDDSIVDLAIPPANSVGTAALQDAAVTLAKLANLAGGEAVLGTQAANGAITAFSWNSYSRSLLALSTAASVREYTQTIQQPGFEWGIPATLPTYFRKIAYGNGIFVTVTDNSANRVAVSTDGIRWKAYPMHTGTTNSWTGIAYGNGVFVAFGNAGTAIRLAYSVDGKTWFPANLPITLLNIGGVGVTFGVDRFVAMSLQSGVASAYSYDGKTWFAGSVPPATNYTHVTYGNGVFVAVPQSGTTAIWSADGITWTTASLGTSTSFTGLAYGSGRFVAMTGSGDYRISNDGVSWGSSPGSALPISNRREVVYGRGLFVTSDNTAGIANQFATSSDGITWTQRSSPFTFNNGPSHLCYGNGVFVGVNLSGDIFISGVIDSSVAATTSNTAFATTDFSYAFIRSIDAAAGRTVLDVYSKTEVDAKSITDGDKGDVTVTNNGQTWTVNSTPNVVIDALTFDGTQTTFNLESDAEPITPLNAASLLISLNGVIQQPGVAYTVSGSTITFAVAPAATDSFFGVYVAGTGSGGYPQQRVYVQDTQPTAPGPYLWIDTTGGDLQFWIETGE